LKHSNTSIPKKVKSLTEPAKKAAFDDGVVERLRSALKELEGLM